MVTGLGVVAPNASSVPELEEALRKGRSGISFQPVMAEHGFGCQVAGVPTDVDARAAAVLTEHELHAMNQGQRMTAVAALEAWRGAGLARAGRDATPDWESGAVLGTGVGGVDTLTDRVVGLVDRRQSRRLGSTAVEQTMASGVSACVAGLLGLGNQVTTNSSACATGTEAVLQGAERIRSGQAERMLCGGTEAASHYVWAAFDAMRVLCRSHNDAPERASRPMSASAAGFVPAAGAGLLLLESLDAALERGAPILAELAGGALNCGGQRGGGSMTAPNPEGVRRCIRAALADAGVTPEEVDAIGGHLTATRADPLEVAAWTDALERRPGTLPPITATKSLTGHALGAAGGIECVAAVLMLAGRFVHASLNCEDLHPEIAPHSDSIPRTSRKLPGLRTLVKASFGFGDVNACVVFRGWEGQGARPGPRNGMEETGR